MNVEKLLKELKRKMGSIFLKNDSKFYYNKFGI